MSPRSSEQLDELREQRKAEILQAALALFAKQGFHNTSIEQIRKKAGVSKGLIYNYFEKKEDLVTAILMREVDEGDDLLAQMCGSVPWNAAVRRVREELVLIQQDALTRLRRATADLPLEGPTAALERKLERDLDRFESKLGRICRSEERRVG